MGYQGITDLFIIRVIISIEMIYCQYMISIYIFFFFNVSLYMNLVLEKIINILASSIQYMAAPDLQESI